jgi:hypothetical protein
MQSHYTEPPREISDAFLTVSSGYVEEDYLAAESPKVLEPTRFQSRYVDFMEMGADAATVAHYLDCHQEWFRRCAHPMKVEPIGQTGYALIIGRYGAFGYDVEPRVGLDLLPQNEGVYRIETIPVPNIPYQGYDVDFKATMSLVEQASQPQPMTRVEWQLDLAVMIQFPRFIHALPKPIIQTTGDRLLHQIVRQVSRRLTYKVLEDFHGSLGLPMPKNASRHKRAAQ